MDNSQSLPPEPIKDHVCPYCKAEYRGESWKTRCYDCYKNFRYLKKRIQPLRQYLGRHDAIYIAHPSVTAEEVNAWIKEQKIYAGWGAQEYDKTKLKIFVDNTNFD